MDSFNQTIINVHGDKGQLWLEKLPEIIKNCQSKWLLNSFIPFENLSYNYVCKTTDNNNRNLVVKIGFPCKEFISEVKMLKISKSNGYVKLIDYDENLSALLLEQALPGRTLAEVENEEAVIIASDLMKKIWMPLSEKHNFPLVENWYNNFMKSSKTNNSKGNFPIEMIEKAINTFNKLNNSIEKKMILHGDLHHNNIIASEDTWIAIDPKGVIGDPVFEVAAFLRNYLMNQPNRQDILEQRINLFSEKLGFSKQRIIDWGFTQTVLSAWWSYEDNFEWQSDIECAELFLQIKKNLL